MAHEWFTGHNRWPNCLQPRGLSFESLTVSPSLHISGIFYLKLVADTLKKSAVATLEGIACLRNFLKSLSRWWSVTSEKKKKKIRHPECFFLNWATDLKLNIFLSFENKGMLWRMENIQKEYSRGRFIKNLVLALDFHIPKKKINCHQVWDLKSVFIREACLQSEGI